MEYDIFTIELFSLIPYNIYLSDNQKNILKSFNKKLII